MEKCSTSIMFWLSFPSKAQSRKYIKQNLTMSPCSLRWSIRSWINIFLNSEFFFFYLFTTTKVCVYESLGMWGRRRAANELLIFNPIITPNSFLVNIALLPLKLNSITFSFILFNLLYCHIVHYAST